MLCLGASCVIAPSILGLHAAPALAQDTPEARDVTVARQEFRAGIAAAQAGRWEEAREHFARSYALNPRRSALFNLAGAQARTGQLVAAAESYREYLGEDEERAEEARALLGELEARVPTLRLRVTLADDDALTLDGEPLRRLLLASPIPVDPGAHRVAVTRGEAEVAAQSFEAVEGAAVEVALDVPPPPEPAAIPEVTLPPEQPRRSAPAAAVAVEDPAEVDGEGGDDVLGAWWLWTIVGVVVAGAVVAGVAIALTPGPAPQSDGFGDLEILRVP